MHIILLILCVLVFSTADYFAANWGNTRETKSLILTLAIGPFAYILFGLLATTTSLAKAGGYVNSGIVLCSAAAGILFLGERLNKLSMIGLGVIILGLVLLVMGKVETTSAN